MAVKAVLRILQAPRNGGRSVFALDGCTLRPISAEDPRSGPFPEVVELLVHRNGPLHARVRATSFETARECLLTYVGTFAPGASCCWDGRSTFYIERGLTCPQVDEGAEDMRPRRMPCYG